MCIESGRKTSTPWYDDRCLHRNRSRGSCSHQVNTRAACLRAPIPSLPVGRRRKLWTPSTIWIRQQPLTRRTGTCALPFEDVSWHRLFFYSCLVIALHACHVSWHRLLVRSEAWHDTKYFGSWQYDTNIRAVSCLECQHGGLHSTACISGRV